MIIPSNPALSRLQSDEAVESLAQLLWNHWVHQDVSQWVPPSEIAHGLHRILKAWSVSSEAQTTLEQAFLGLQKAHQRDFRPAGQLIGPEAQEAISALLRRPVVLGGHIVQQLLHSPSVRKTARDILFDVLLDFGSKLKAPVTQSSVAKGLSGLAKLAAEQAKSRGGTLGVLAGEMVGAVSTEVEKQFEKRVTEFVDVAVDKALGLLADEWTSQAKVGRQVELRMAAWETMKTLPVHEWVAEMQKLQMSEVVQKTQKALQAWLSKDTSLHSLEAWLSTWVPSSPPRTVKEVLQSLGMLEATQQMAIPWLQTQARSLLQSQPFALWFAQWALPPSSTQGK